MNVTLADKIKSLRREIAMRYKVYPRRVAEGRMTQAEAEADREIEIATAILSDYERTQRKADQLSFGI
ncbi:MAG: hypothetical protein LCH53_13150 [Bacteroidetes bacterium]|nr:hypothetical protein [Bacteroidota bacterium]